MAVTIIDRIGNLSTSLFTSTMVSACKLSSSRAAIRATAFGEATGARATSAAPARCPQKYGIQEWNQICRAEKVRPITLPASLGALDAWRST